jgi:hypothetical protein
LSSALVVDTVAPTGAITINNGAAYAASRTVTLNLSASDNGSGVTGMAFSEDGVDFSAFESYVVSKAWTLSAGGGTKIVYARFLDSAGNISAPVSDTIVLDQSPPTGSVAINGGALNTTGTNVTLVVSASAATPASQVSEMIFSNDGANWSAWQSYSAAASWMLSTGDGLKTVYAKFRDAAGNVSSAVSDTITLDTTVGTDYGFTINDGALFTNRVTVTLSIGAKSFTSEMMVSNDGGFGGAAWEPYTSRRIWQITQYGIYVLPRTVYMKFKDAAGNSSIPFQDDIILDVTAPTGSVQIIPGASASSRAAPVPRRMTTNPVGGRAKPSSIYTTYFPSILNGYPCSVPTGAANVTLRLSAADDVSGVGAMIISNRPDFYCASWEGYVISQAWYVPEGTTTVYVKFRDNAGNISAPATATVTR